MIVGVALKFDAAHYLPHYQGNCANLHGHTWHVEVEVCGEVNDYSGMVIDLKQLKGDVEAIIGAFDHHELNNHFHNPTCENIAQWIHDHLIARYIVQTVKVREGEGGWARI